MTESETSPQSSGLGKQAGILAASRVFTTIAQLAPAIILARVLPQEKNGALLILLTSYIAVLAVAQLGLPESVFFYFGKLAHDAQRAFLVLTARTLSMLSIAAAAILALLNYLPFWKVEVQGLFLLLIPLVVLELPCTPLPNALIASNRTAQAGLLNIVIGILQFFAIILPAVVFRSLPAILISLVFYALIRLTLSAVLVLRFFPASAVKLPEDLAVEQLKYSIPLSAAQGLWTLNKQIDKWIVGLFLPAALVAAYGFGAWELPLIPVIAYSIGAVMMPKLVGHYFDNNPQELLALWLRAIQRSTAVIVPLVILFEVISEEIITLLFSTTYIDAVIPFRIYTVILLQRVAAYSSVLKAVDETRAITISAILLLLINTALSFPLVLWLGIAGPPIGTLIANVVTWTYVMLKIRSALEVKLPDVFPFAYYGRTLMVCLAAGAAAYFSVHSLIANIWLSLALKSILFVALYLGLARLTGVLSYDDWQYYRKMLKRGKQGTQASSTA